MTSAQKKNQERFKRVVKRAAAIRRANPRLSQGEAVKKAWAELKRGKVSGSAKPAAKRKPIRAKKTGSHKDINSHNVKISVVSGVSREGRMYQVRDRLEKDIAYYLNAISKAKEYAPRMNKDEKENARRSVKVWRGMVTRLKKQLREQNALINAALK